MGALLDLDDLTERHPGARAELEALRKDAERYRWLRNGPHMWLIQPRGTMDLPHDEEIWPAGALDAEIDRAMAAK